MVHNHQFQSDDIELYQGLYALAGFRRKLLGLDEESVRRLQSQFFVNYKVAIIIFNLTPYIALSIMA